jgi:hypothetical protein
MPRVREVIAHILHHTNAEAAERDASQVAGVAQRAQLVRDAVQSFAVDNRDMTLSDLLLAIYNAIPSGADRDSFRRALTNIRAESGTRPQLAIQEWVGRRIELSAD